MPSFAPAMSMAYLRSLIGCIASFEWWVVPPVTQKLLYSAQLEVAITKGKAPVAPGIFDAREVIAALKDRIRAT